MAGGRDESNIFLMKRMTMMVLCEGSTGSRRTDLRRFCRFCRFCNNHLQILQKILQYSPASHPIPAGVIIFCKIACNFAKNKCKVCKIAIFVAIVRYKIALYNANDFVQIVQIVCTNSCKFAN